METIPKRKTKNTTLWKQFQNWIVSSGAGTAYLSGASEFVEKNCGHFGIVPIAWYFFVFSLWNWFHIAEIFSGDFGIVPIVW
jgi:hypothetical protein